MGALDGRHALITGGGTGIGAAIARALADAGAASRSRAGAERRLDETSRQARQGDGDRRRT